MFVLGAVVPAVTGAEALYADMGQFGRQPIRLAWFGLVLPAVMLRDPTSIRNPFYLMFPDWAQAPMLLLATAATVIASQAVMSGAFSMTRQAIQLGYCPRLAIVHTSENAIGRVYIPRVNWMLLAAVIALVLGFQSSEALASAYGSRPPARWPSTPSSQPSCSAASGAGVTCAPAPSSRSTSRSSAPTR